MWLLPQLFRTMPVRSFVIFLAAVGCLFSAVGVVNDLFNLQVSSGPRLAVQIFSSAIFSMGWAGIFSRAATFRPLIRLICFQVLFYAFVNEVLPPVHRSLNAEEMQSAIAVRGILITIFIALGYSLFLGFFRKEGKRYFAAYTEIQLASSIQSSLVPPISVRRGNLEIYGQSLPSGAVGGDLLDVVQHPEACLAYVSDVSGRGVKAGVLMSMIKTSVRTRFAAAPPCAEGFFEDLNQVLHPMTDAQSYATMAFLLFPQKRSGPVLACRPFARFALA